MCTGFGVIVTKDGRYLFVEPDSGGNISHSTILERAGIRENTDCFIRSFVRVEIPTWKMKSFRFDEIETLPAWVNKSEIKEHCEKLMERVFAVWNIFRNKEEDARKTFFEKDQIINAEYIVIKNVAYIKYSCTVNEPQMEAVASIKKVRQEMVEKLSSITGYVPSEG